jgi:hypothetical protein
MPELMHTVEAMHRVEKRKQKFMAALQGIDIDKEETPKNTKVPTAEEVKARAIARLTGDKNLAGAIEHGFTPDTGLEYKIAEGAEIG